MKEGWEYRKLGEVCNIYQPKTLSSKELVEDGKYLVYGANGVIGKYNSYNHESSEVLMTCRGATCGTINVSKPHSWINGNAMVIHPQQNKLSQNFLFYLLKGLDLSDVITGAAQPQITRQSLAPKKIGIPPLSEQQHIVEELDLLSSIIEKKKAQLNELDNLAQSLFYEMFGNPISNEKGWEVKKIGEITDTKIGITYKPTAVNDDGVIVLRSSNIQNSEIDLTDIVRVNCNIKDDKFVRNGDILMCTRNGSLRLVGKVAMINNLPERMTYGAFMTVIRSQYNAFLFMFFQLPAFRQQLITAQTATINQITIKMLNDVKVIVPPIELQQQFASKIEAIKQNKELIKQSINEVTSMYNSRMEYWFNS